MVKKTRNIDKMMYSFDAHLNLTPQPRTHTIEMMTEDTNELVAQLLRFNTVFIAKYLTIKLHLPSLYAKKHDIFFITDNETIIYNFR